MTDQPLPDRPSAHSPVRRPAVDFMVLVALLVLIAWINVASGESYRTLTWSVTVLLIGAFVVYFGFSTTGQWRGTFINRRNLVSLPRLQMLSWTALVLASLLAGALMNVGAPEVGVVPMNVPQSIWMLMGISGASAAAAPIVDSRAKAMLSSNAVPDQARWNDLFMCEEVGLEHVVDVAKLQMFFFTFILILAYGAEIAARLQPGEARFEGLPPVDDGLNALLFFSHAGYLMSKGTPAFSGQGKTLPANEQPTPGARPAGQQPKDTADQGAGAQAAGPVSGTPDR